MEISGEEMRVLLPTFDLNKQINFKPHCELESVVVTKLLGNFDALWKSSLVLMCLR